MNNPTILSVEGGGMKGMFSAAFLAALEEKLNKSIFDHIDLRAGCPVLFAGCGRHLCSSGHLLICASLRNIVSEF